MIRELRIGNLTAFGKVYSIEEDSFRTMDKKGECFKSTWADIQPIPLTEECLLKFGFYKEDNSPSKEHGNYYSIGVYDYKYSFAYASFREDWGFYHSYTDAPNEEDDNKFDAISFGIKYVHQLQNLYFALTNEELTINNQP